MAHHIYRSQAVVLGGRNSGEADRTLRLFTRDLGLITVSARGLRRESSKLRYVLQTGSWADGNFVRGKEGWRLTTAVPLESRIPGNLHARRALANVLRTLVRFLPSEIPDPKLYRELDAFTLALAADPARAPEWEIAFLVRMLSVLGYWGARVPEVILDPGRFDEVLSGAIIPLRFRITEEINRVLEHAPA